MNLIPSWLRFAISLDDIFLSLLHGRVPSLQTCREYGIRI